jgi:hypothetical protein
MVPAPPLFWLSNRNKNPGMGTYRLIRSKFLRLKTLENLKNIATTRMIEK